jgi:hypothetical protein
MCIAVLMIVWGTLASGRATSHVRSPIASALWRGNAVGAALALYLFMADALRALPEGIQAMRSVLPHSFNWPLFGVALALMAAPIAAFCRSPVENVRIYDSMNLKSKVLDP